MVEFVVRVPDGTPPDQAVFLAGDGPVLGNWSADAVRLQRWDDGTHHVRLDLPRDFHGRFLVTCGRWRTVESDGHGRARRPRELHVTRSVTVEANVLDWGRNSVRYHHHFGSEYLPHSRTLAVWVPPDYDLDRHRDYPVLYMHDGQNLFDPETAFAGNPWWADEVAEREIRRGRVDPLVIVGVANTADRLREYGPRRDSSTELSREYGHFLVEEVKPFIDSNYRTLGDPEDTGVGGSSMGGLISLHLCQWYPAVFGKCAAMSPALWYDRDFFLRGVAIEPEWLRRCRVWLDMGTREGSTEQGMEGMVRRARRLAWRFERRGLKPGEDFRFEVVEGGLHNEAAWNARFDRMLRFLYPPPLG